MIRSFYFNVETFTQTFFYNFNKDKTKQNKTKQNKTKHKNKTKQNKTKSKTKQKAIQIKQMDTKIGQMDLNQRVTAPFAPF